jgi:hypothetical protein
VTTSEERRQHLIAACGSLGSGGRLFLFAAKERLGHKDIMPFRWLNGRGETVSLVDSAIGD